MCQEYGLSEAKVISTEEDVHCTAYTRLVLDIGMSSSAIHLAVAMAPCTLGYAEIGRRMLVPDGSLTRSNRSVAEIMSNVN